MISPTAIYRWMPVFVGIGKSAEPAWVTGDPYETKDEPKRWVVQVKAISDGGVSVQPLRFIRAATAKEAARMALPKRVRAGMEPRKARPSARRPARENSVVVSLHDVAAAHGCEGELPDVMAKHGMGRDGE